MASFSRIWYIAFMIKKNIVLIGMPGVGKSTIGVLLAKALGMDFLDSDIVIQKKKNNTLQKIIDTRGLTKFLEIENEVLAGINVQNTVIATGGSAIYGTDAMENLKKNSITIYLRLDSKLLKRRLSNIKTRGVVIKRGQTIEDLFQERNPLYEKYADYSLDTTKLNIEETVSKITEFVSI